MHISRKSAWNKNQIESFLGSSLIPVRLSFLNTLKEPQICSLWYEYQDGVLWCASHKNSFLIRQLLQNTQVAFEVSLNDYPYKGVRGKGMVHLSTKDSGTRLAKLIDKYLGDGNSKLSSWLLSRAEDEYIIEITPTFVSAWDFSGRMET